MRFSAVLVVAVCLPSGVALADELEVGDWTIQYGPNGVESVHYGDTHVLERLGVTVYAPDYKSAHFALTGADVRHQQEGETHQLIFARDVPGKAKGIGTLEVSGNTLRWSVEIEIAVDGRLEIHVPVPRETIETPAGDLFYRVGHAKREVVAGHSWSTQIPKSEVALKTADLDIVLRPKLGEGSWLFQDRRQDRFSVVRMVGSLAADGKEPVRAMPSIEIAVEALSADEARVRRLDLGQRRVTRSEIPVKNAGFEGPEGLAGWGHGPNGTLVKDRPAEGEQCAKLAVSSPDEPNVYLTQQVPVTPGALYQVSCRIRPEGVERADEMRMSSVGAVLIHEWADPDGKWIYAGDYSDSFWGSTTAWNVARCEELLAPADVGYAVIFLGLRGLGTAYFDDVKLAEVKRHMVVMSPLDGAAFADNRPLFSWRPEPIAPEYTIECRGEGGGFTAQTQDASYRPPDRLPPGSYEWQVSASGTQPSVKWAFTQTAPQDADTTGPEVALQPHAFTNRDEFLPVSADDPSGVDFSGARLVVGGEEMAAEVRLREPGAIVRPREGWPRGGHHVKVIVPDEVGNTSSGQTWVVNTPPPPRTFTWTYDQGIFDGEKRFLPLAMYQVPPEHMPRVKQAGFNVVHTYEFEGSQNDDRAREFLDAAQSNGLQAFIGFDRGKSSGAGLVQMDFDHVAARIGALRDHPGLLAWYLFDEPDLAHQYVSPGNLRKLYEFINTLDPYHPVIVTFAMDNSVAQYGKCYDVHWTQVYQTTQYVRDRIERHRGMMERWPLAAILTCNDRKQSPILKGGGEVDDAAFTPTLAKFRADIAMAFALRSSGLAWWWYGDNRRSWLTAADVPHGWAWLSEAVAEIHELEPLLTADGSELRVELETDPEDASVVARAKRVGDRVLLIVASADEERAVSFRASCPRLPSPAAAKVRFEQREVGVAEGAFEDELEPLGRHIYEIVAVEE